MMANFNSIKVQLKRVYCAKYAVKQVFQFHKGTIKTLMIKRNISRSRKFQFHKGTIKTVRG